MGFCTKAGSIMQIVGYVLLVIKIVVPILIIILGSIDLAKAVTSGEEKDVKENATKLFKRILIGMVIFFLPSIVRALYFSLTQDNDNSGFKNDVSKCIVCITSPSQCDTSYEGEILK
jgi:uncharacterized membrane protein YjgN (DUF898 family)